MSQKNVVVRSASSPGDIAVNGVISGVLAGVLMAAYLALAGWITGEGAGVMLGRFDPTGGRALVGLLGHLAMSAVLGAGYSLPVTLVLRKRALPGWVTGLVYGLALWLLATLVILPATGSALMEVPALHWALAHVVYGLSLGWLVARHD